MNLKRSATEDPEISLTGLIDVVFLLLIFFMVSTSFEHQAVLKVDLPEAKNVTSPVDQPNSFELVIDQKGQFYLNDRQLIDAKPATIEAAFIEAAGDDRSMPIILRADAETPAPLCGNSNGCNRPVGFYQDVHRH